MQRSILLVTFVIILSMTVFGLCWFSAQKINLLGPAGKQGFSSLIEEPIQSPTPLPPTPTPTPRPLTFAEMNERYGPCVFAPVMMYHHIQSLEEAAKKNAAWLSVPPETFRRQMEYLKNKGYRPVSMPDLAHFFETGTALSGKPVLITFDDGYDDIYLNAFPILKEFGFQATVFLPTGLMDNYAYLTWSRIDEMKNSGLVFFANHTWSHHNVLTDQATLEKEIGLADGQLAEKGLNIPKVFSYPYGLASNQAKQYLSQKGYSLAFTTVYGHTLCQKLRMELPRIRVGDTDLSAYGL